MNREIKFRAWDGKEMHQNVCINHEGKAIKYGYRSTDWVEDANAGIPMQFTGLLDKNGVEIYEGDIVAVKVERNFKYEYKVVSLIEWCDYSNGLQGWTQLSPIKDFEVIGNIYESPELLNQSK